jgi:outer membrane protein OmpA-like peptidoglycan-associated protein
MTKIIALIYLIIGSSLLDFGPGKTELLEQAEEAFYDENYNLALIRYNELEKSYPETTEHLYHKYIVEHMTTKRGGDLSNLLDMAATKGKEDVYYNYWLGKIYMKRYDFDQAKNRMETFLLSKAEKNEMLLAEISDLLRWIDQAKIAHSNPNDYSIEPLPKGINTANQEISPAFFGGHDELVFLSDRKAPDPIDFEKSKFLAYHVVKTGEEWSNPTLLEKLPEFTFEKAKIEIVEDVKQLFYFTEQYEGDLYYNKYEENSEWSSPIEFDAKIRNKNIESHFYINDAMNHILFASGKPYNHDIWQTQLIDGNWSSPKPISGSVNTEFDEDSPFLSHDGKKLFFSSERPSGIGGYDIFVSTWNDDTKAWGQPVNMGFPINTMDDDIYFEVLPGDEKGFLASNRLHSEGGFDLYYFHKEKKITVAGKVLNKDSDTPMTGASVRLHPKSYEDESFGATTDENGEFEMKIFNREEYVVEVLVNNEKVYSGDYTSSGSYTATELSLNLNVSLPSSELEEKILAEEVSKTSEDDAEAKFEAVEETIYFPFASAELSEKSLNALAVIIEKMKNREDVRVEIAGHTDNVGSEEFNMMLSKRRANSVKDYLLNKGVEAKSISVKALGSSQPVSSNSNETDGRNLNRRSKIVVKKK